MADRETDSLYARMRNDFGARSARANGYRSEDYFRREQETLFEFLKTQTGVLLDIGSGSGLMLLPLANNNRTVVGIDFNQLACIAAKSNGINVINGDAFALPLSDQSIDEVVNCQFLNQQPSESVERLAEEVFRVLKPGGQAIFVWRNAGALIHQVAHGLLTAWDRMQGRPLFPQYRHDVAVVSEQLSRAGFHIEHRELTCPPIGWRSESVHGVLGRIIGASCLIAAIKR